MSLPFPILSAEEAAGFIRDGQTVAFSGFTPAGAPKAIPLALARLAELKHEKGHAFKIGVLSGASSGSSVDGALARANAVSFRAPFQADPSLRAQINSGAVRFLEMHVSKFPQALRYGELGPVHWAVVEACDVTPGGGIVLSTAVGATPTFLNQAERVLIELNRRQPHALLGMHDLLEPEDPPTRRILPIYTVRDRAGAHMLMIPRSKIAGVVLTDSEDEGIPFEEHTAVNQMIGHKLSEFLVAEIKAGRIPQRFLPMQSGLGETGNSVLAAMAENKHLPNFSMFTEVVQDAGLQLLEQGRCEFVSATALSFSPTAMRQFVSEIEQYRQRILLRPQEISNHPELIRRLGVISVNTAIEVDLHGNVNSTHIMGTRLMNGIGGSADFTRNAYLSIFCCPSTRMQGRISTIVPLVTHVDQNDHSVQVIVTEQGVADLRGRDPLERAHLIIAHCAHPDYREELLRYSRLTDKGCARVSLKSAFAMHEHWAEGGDMRGVSWSQPDQAFAKSANS